MPDLDRLSLLMVKFAKGSISPTEQVELDFWLNASEANRLAFEERISEEKVLEGLALLQEGEVLREANREKIEYSIPGHNGENNTYWLRGNWRTYTTAAAIFLCVASGLVYLLIPRQTPAKTQVIAGVKADFAPGGNKAILTLADNSVIVLDSTRDGQIALQGGSRVQKQAGGQLAYVPAANTVNVGFNTITTPPGGQYAVVLPDGSKVWLDAASSLRFPTAFPGNDRVVELTGQAYLEVAKNSLKPFRVMVNSMAVSVLGTHFNITAYAGEPVRTTLLEGSVRVTNNGQQLLLRPGQQAKLAENRLNLIDGIDTEEAIAWKNGFFQFTNADIKTVMNAIGRWYGVELKYEGDLRDHRLTALIRKNSYASDVLEALSSSGYHFKITGKTITVLP